MTNTFDPPSWQKGAGDIDAAREKLTPLLDDRLDETPIELAAQSDIEKAIVNGIINRNNDFVTPRDVVVGRMQVASEGMVETAKTYRETEDQSEAAAAGGF